MSYLLPGTIMKETNPLVPQNSYSQTPQKIPFSKMPFGLSKRKPRVGSVNSNPMPEKFCCMMLRLNIDCNACCRKLRRVILRMKEIETHMIEKQQRRVCVCGRFMPADVAIKIRNKMNRRVEIMEVQEFGGENENENDQADLTTAEPTFPMVVYPGQAPSFQTTMPMA